MTRINEAKTMAKHGSCDCKYKLNSVTSDSNQNWNNKICQYECRNYRACKKDLVGILLHVFMRIASISKVLLMIWKLCVMKLYIICYRNSINKCGKYYTNKCHKYCVNKLS